MAQKRFGVIFALIALALIPYWRAILVGELILPEGYFALLAPELKSQLRQTPWNALWWDSIGQFWAWRTEASRQVYHGRMPLWTNKVGCGFPFLANPQTQSLYPPALVGSFVCNWLGESLTLPIPSAKLMAWLAFFHTLLALVGTYLLIRSYGISRLSSIVGAAAYGLGSFQVAWALLPTLPATAAWLPLTIWLLRKLVAATADGKAKIAIAFGIGFSLSLAMMLLAGHGQIAIYSLLALILFASLEIVPAYRRVKFVAILAIALPFGLSFLLASAQLLPTMELTPLTHRHGAPTWEGYKAFAQRGLTIADWATMALPFLFGNPIDGNYFGKESFADYCAYAGFGLLVLAVWGIFGLGKIFALPILQKQSHSQKATHQHAPNPERKQASALARLKAYKPTCLHACGLAPLPAFSLFLLGALLASGSTFNLPLYFLLPGFSQLGTPSRAVFLCQLALGLMAAWALEMGRGTGYKGQGKMKAISVIAVALVAIALAIGYAGWWLSSHLPNFLWSDWISLLTAQNIGITLGFLAIVIFSLRQSLIPSLQSPTFRYAIAILLIGELSWFAAQQIPTARLLMVRQALRIAELRLKQIVNSLPSPRRHLSAPRRLLPVGGDWSLRRYPQTLLPPNSALLLLRVQIADARNYDSLLLHHHKAVMALFSNGNPCPLENGNLILMPARQVNLQEAKELAQIVGAEGVVKTFGKHPQIAEIVSAELKKWEIVKMPRAFVPLKVRYVKTVSEAINQLRDCLKGTALLVASPQKHWASPYNYALVTLDKDAFVKVRVESVIVVDGRHPAWLVLSDTSYPGWKAFYRAGYKLWRELPITVANGAFRACHLPDMPSEVVWVYFPSSFVVGLFLSCIGVFCVSAIGVAILPLSVLKRKTLR